MKVSEIVRETISLARAVGQARDVEGAEDDSPLLTSGGDTSTMTLRTAEERRLREFLEAQPPSVVYLLTAIMYLGRGDFDAKELPDQYVDTREAYGNPKWAVRRMLGKMTLKEYLEEGVMKLAQAGMDLDKLLPG